MAGERCPSSRFPATTTCTVQGLGYYDMIDRLNAPPAQQTASDSARGLTDGEWQFVAMDTGLHDFSPLAVEDAVTYVEPDEVEWIARRVREFPGRTICSRITSSSLPSPRSARQDRTG